MSLQKLIFFFYFFLEYLPNEKERLDILSRTYEFSKLLMLENGQNQRWNGLGVSANNFAPGVRTMRLRSKGNEGRLESVEGEKWYGWQVETETVRQLWKLEEEKK